MDRVRRRVAGGLREAEQIDVQLAHAIRSVGARNIRHDVSVTLDFGAVAIRRARRAADEMVALVGRENEKSVALINAGFLQVQKERAESSIVIGQLSHVGSFAGTESAFGGGCLFVI